MSPIGELEDSGQLTIYSSDFSTNSSDESTYYYNFETGDARDQDTGGNYEITLEVFGTFVHILYEKRLLIQTIQSCFHFRHERI